jgi:hypothetical protein
MTTDLVQDLGTGALPTHGQETTLNVADEQGMLGTGGEDGGGLTAALNSTDSDFSKLVDAATEDDIDAAFRALARRLADGDLDLAANLARAVHAQGDSDTRCLALELLSNAGPLLVRESKARQDIAHCLACAAFDSDQNVRFTALACIDGMPKEYRHSMLLLLRSCAESDPDDRVRSLASRILA